MPCLVLRSDWCVILFQVYSFGPHYVFSIASLESFEQKMNVAQAELKIQPQDSIPITYRAPNELLWVCSDIITIFTCRLSLKCFKCPSCKYYIKINYIDTNGFKNTDWANRLTRTLPQNTVMFLNYYLNYYIYIFT